MKVVLLQDVPKVGKKNDIKEVADGFALNSLIPRGLAETATGKSVARVELLKKQEIDKKKIRQELLLKNFGDLKGVKITIERSANKEGHLFAAIHEKDIAEAVKSSTRLDIEPEFLIINEPIKTIGEREIGVEIGERKINFTLEVKSVLEDSKK